MKYIQLFILSLVIISNLQCQEAPKKQVERKEQQEPAQEEVENPWLFGALNKEEILRRLFDNAQLVRSSDNTLLAKWKPNFAERLAFSVSEDGMCYTQIDTILKFSKGEDKHALFVFATYSMEENGKERSYVDACHACAPMLSLALFTEDLNGNEGWSLLNFKKEFGNHGSNGEIGEVGLVQIGKKEFALSLAGGYMAQGFYSEGFTYYELLDYSPIFRVTTISDNGGAGLGAGETYGFETTVKIVPSNEAYYRIRCTSKGTNYLYKQKKLVLVDGVKIYAFDEEKGEYVEEQ